MLLNLIMLNLQLKEDTGWKKLELLNGWKNYNDVYGNNEFNELEYRVKSGIVYVRGLVVGSDSTDIVIASLPQEARPRKQNIITCYSSHDLVARIDIDRFGGICLNYVPTPESKSWISLDNISFPIN